MELVLTRIAKRKTYTIGRLETYPQPLPRGRGAEIDSTSVKSGEKLTEHPSRSGGEGGGSKAGYFCDTLEPPVLEMKTSVSKDAVLRSKVKTQALKPFAIPEGRYAVVITYSPKLKQYLPLLLGVPMFSGIRIHAGNSVKDTLGCILVGQNLKKGMVFNSNAWLKRLKQKIVEAKDRGEAVWITIK